MVPADQRLDAGGDIVGRADDRLIENVQFAFYERVAKILLDRALVLGHLQKFAREKTDATATAALRRV